jgi:hypothetical protein
VLQPYKSLLLIRASVTVFTVIIPLHLLMCPLVRAWWMFLLCLFSYSHQMQRQFVYNVANVSDDISVKKPSWKWSYTVLLIANGFNSKRSHKITFSPKICACERMPSWLNSYSYVEVVYHFCKYPSSRSTLILNIRLASLSWVFFGPHSFNLMLI